MSTLSVGFRSALAVGLVLGFASLCVADPTREGSGERRIELDKMEFYPLPVAAWAGLSDWTGGNAIDATAAKGKVVLFYTWSSWYERSTRQIAMVDRLAKDFADKGLIVIGVHDKQGWDAGKAVMTESGVGFPVALDAENKFRASLLVDQDPDFYLVDRAGNLRFADITTSSLTDAVTTLVNETEEKAAGILEAMASKEAADMAAAKKTTTIRQGFDLTQIPDNLAIRRPKDTDFEDASWPGRVKSWERQIVGQNGGDDDGPGISRQLSLPQGAEWLSNRRPSQTGARAFVVYIWNPGEYKSFHQAQEKLEQLQKKYQRELIVVGVVSRFRTGNQFNSFGTQNTEREERERKQLMDHWERLGKSTNFLHYNVLDVERAAFDALYGGSNPQGGDPAPIAMIFSSDQALRWVGDPNHDLFDLAIERVLSVDPWVKARRKVEADWIKSKTPMGG